MNADEAIEYARTWPSTRRGTSTVALLLAELDSRGAAIERVQRTVTRREADDDGRGPAAISVAELRAALDGGHRGAS